MKSTMWAQRVVIGSNGRWVGKGRPAKAEKKTRTCIFVTLKEKNLLNHTEPVADQLARLGIKASKQCPYNRSKNKSQQEQFKPVKLSTLKAVKVVAPAAPVAVNVPVDAPVAA